MNRLHFKYVLVGAGGAGSAAAQAIRQHDAQGSVLLIGQEHSRPYLRTALSKQYLRRQMNRQQIVTEPAGWHAQHNIEMRTGRRVAHLDAARRAMALDNGEEVTFNKLLLATGAAPRPLDIPGADLPNVFYLRTIDDCDRLHHAIDNARGRAVVIGSGLLAVEVAASLKQLNLHVELVMGRAYPWGKFAGETSGKFIARYLEQHQVEVHCGVAPQRLEGDGRVQRVITTDGSPISCDFVVAANGIVINRDLLRGTPIAAEKAILVDDHCRTNVPDIYAAGDAAAVFDRLFGKHRIIDHWESARVTGAIAGANMAGADLKYEALSSFTSEIFDATLHVWGEGRLVDHRLVRGVPSAEAPDFAEIGVASDGRVAQVIAFGRADEHHLFESMVKRRLHVDGAEEAIKDPSRALDALLE